MYRGLREFVSGVMSIMSTAACYTGGCLLWQSEVFQQAP
jgi:hypothetical protein